MAVDYTGLYCGAMDIRESTRSYERWLGRHVRLLPADLRRKHARMSESPFVLRVDRAPAVAGLLAHRAGPDRGRARRVAAPARHGMGNRQFAPRDTRRAHRRRSAAAARHLARSRSAHHGAGDRGGLACVARLRLKSRETGPSAAEGAGTDHAGKRPGSEQASGRLHGREPEPNRRSPTSTRAEH